MKFEVQIKTKGDTIEGKVASPVATHYVVLRRQNFAEWEALYAEDKATGEVIELPACFRIRDAAIVALETELRRSGAKL